MTQNRLVGVSRWACPGVFTVGLVLFCAGTSGPLVSLVPLVLPPSVQEVTVQGPNRSGRGWNRETDQSASSRGQHVRLSWVWWGQNCGRVLVCFWGAGRAY